MATTVQKNKMTTKAGHKNKNMILYFKDNDGYRQRTKIPSEIEDQLLVKGVYKKPWSGYLLAYIISFKNPLTANDVEELTLLAKNSGWTLRQEHGELSEDYDDLRRGNFCGDNMITENDKEFLQWVYDRLENTHQESPNVDYMIKLKKIIDNMKPYNEKLFDALNNAAEKLIAMPQEEFDILLSKISAEECKKYAPLEKLII